MGLLRGRRWTAGGDCNSGVGLEAVNESGVFPAGRKIMTQNQENKPKNPSHITSARALIALFLLVLFVSWFFGWYLRRR